MCKVLLIAGAFPNLPCGVGDYTYWLSLRLADRGIDTHVLTVRSPKVISDRNDLNGVCVYPIVPSWSLSDIPVIIREIKKIKPGIVHIQYPASFGVANRKILANLLGIVAKFSLSSEIKVVTTFHEFGERSLRWQLRAMLNLFTSDLVICVNRFDVNLVKKYISHKKPVHYIPIASSIPVFPIDAQKRKQIQEMLHITQSDFLLVYFGFITPLKGFDVLLQAIHLLRKEGVQVKLLILTKLEPSKNGYHKELVELIEDLNIQDICLLGTDHYSAQAVSQYLQIADCAVLPFVEGVSERRSSLLAVLTHKLPTITTIGSNLSAEFRDHENMILVPPETSDVIAKEVKNLIGNQRLLESLAEGASKLTQRYSWDEIATNTINVYKQALGFK